MYIAIDIGGTNTRIGASKNGRNFSAIKKFKTPRKFEEGMHKIVKHLQRLGLGSTTGVALRHKIAIALPGSIDAPNKKSPRLPNLPGWSNQPITRILSKKFHASILLINDADAAGIGEARRGAGRGYHKVLYLTISTGIGGARLIDGRIDSKTPSFEPGHYPLITDGRKCGCGRRGCFEAYGSGPAFFKTYGVRPENCRDKKIWAAHTQIIGQGLLNILKHWSPDVVIIGGGLSQAGHLLFTPLRAYMRTHLKIIQPPPILPAKLGDNSGLYGCLEIFSINHPS